LRHFFDSPRTRRPLGLSFGELTVFGLSFWYFCGETCEQNSHFSSEQNNVVLKLAAPVNAEMFQFPRKAAQLRRGDFAHAQRLKTSVANQAALDF